MSKGSIFTNTYYLSGTPIKTVCQPFLFGYVSNSIPSSGISNSNVSLALHEKVTDNGVDITGRVTNVYKLQNINFQLGVSGNSRISQFQQAYQMSAASSNTSIFNIAKYFAPKEVKTATEILSLMKSVMTSGTSTTVSTGLINLSNSVFGCAVKSSYYLIRDSEQSGDFVGGTFGVSTYNPSLAVRTTGSIHITFNYDVYGAGINKTDTLSRTFTTTTNVK